MVLSFKFNSVMHRFTAALPPKFGMKIRARFDGWRKILDPEILHISRFLRHTRLAIDVGANIGVTSKVLSRHFATVEAFEANPCLAAAASRALPSHVHFHSVALSSGEGGATLRIPVSSGLLLDGWASLDRPLAGDESTWKQVPVSTRTLDSFSFRDVDLIKIDVEGHELAVLEGSRDTIARNRPLMIVEVWNAARETVRSFFTGCSYHSTTLEQLCGIPGSHQNLIFLPD